jgi:Mg2+/Co2+ transporter CorC
LAASSQTNGTGRSNRQAGAREATNTETETAEYYQTFLSRLLAVVSHGQPEVVDRLIEIIRSGASQQQIFEALSELGADNNP